MPLIPGCEAASAQRHPSQSDPAVCRRLKTICLNIDRCCRASARGLGIVWRLPIGHMPPLAGGMQCPLMAGTCLCATYRRRGASGPFADAARLGSRGRFMTLTRLSSKGTLARRGFGHLFPKLTVTGLPSRALPGGLDVSAAIDRLRSQRQFLAD